MTNPFWEQQQQLFKTWNENISKMPGMEAYQEMYKSMVPNATEYWNKFFEMMPAGTENFWKSFTPNGADFIPKMWNYQIPGMDAYTKVFDFWKGMGDPVAFMRDYQEKYMDLMQDLFKGFLPAGAAPFFEKPMELLQTCTDFYQSVLAPWMKIDDTIMQRIASGDTTAYIDFFRDFNSKYEESFGKMFNMMGMGLNRESTTDQMHAIDAYIQMLFATAEVAALTLNACRDSMTALVERYQKDVQEGKMITTFHEFYTLWFNVTEETLSALLNTDAFSKAFGEFSDKYAQYLIATNKLQERMLASLPIPTKKDMDSLYKTVYDLRKTVRDLRRELDALKETK